MWGKLTGSNSPYRTELSPESYYLYKHIFDHTDVVVNQFLKKLSSPQVTSEAIHHALTSPYPKTRYPVAGLNGIPLWIIRALVPLFPDRVVDLVKLAL